MNSDDEWFDQLIEYDNDDSGQSTKSYRIVSASKKIRTKKTNAIQFRMLYNFMISHEKKTLGKVKYNKSLEKLCEKLNKAGPPTHDSAQWRRIWINYKAKKTSKSKHSSQNLEDLFEPSSSSFIEQTQVDVDVPEMNNVTFLDDEIGISSKLNKNDGDGVFQIEVMKKLDLLIEQFKSYNSNTEAILTEARKTNELLEKLLEK